MYYIYMYIYIYYIMCIYIYIICIFVYIYIFDNIIQYIFNHHSQEKFFSFCVIFAFLLKDLSRNKVPPFQHCLNTSFHLLDGHNLLSFPLLFPCNSIEPLHFSRIRHWNTMKFTLFAGEVPILSGSMAMKSAQESDSKSLPAVLQPHSPGSSGLQPQLRLTPSPATRPGTALRNPAGISFFSPQNSWKPELNRLFIFEIWDEDSENKISTGIGCGYGYEYDQLMKQSILPSRQVGSDPLLIF